MKKKLKSQQTKLTSSVGKKAFSFSALFERLFAAAIQSEASFQQFYEFFFQQGLQEKVLRWLSQLEQKKLELLLKVAEEHHNEALKKAYEAAEWFLMECYLSNDTTPTEDPTKENRFLSYRVPPILLFFHARLHTLSTEKKEALRQRLSSNNTLSSAKKNLFLLSLDFTEFTYTQIRELRKRLQKLQRTDSKTVIAILLMLSNQLLHNTTQTGSPGLRLRLLLEDYLFYYNPVKYFSAQDCYDLLMQLDSRLLRVYINLRPELLEKIVKGNLLPEQYDALLKKITQKNVALIFNEDSNHFEHILKMLLKLPQNKYIVYIKLMVKQLLFYIEENFDTKRGQTCIKAYNKLARFFKKELPSLARHHTLFRFAAIAINNDSRNIYTLQSRPYTNKTLEEFTINHSMTYKLTQEETDELTPFAQKIYTSIKNIAPGLGDDCAKSWAICLDDPQGGPRALSLFEGEIPIDDSTLSFDCIKITNDLGENDHLRIIPLGDKGKCFNLERERQIAFHLCHQGQTIATIDAYLVQICSLDGARFFQNRVAFKIFFEPTSIQYLLATNAFPAERLFLSMRKIQDALNILINKTNGTPFHKEAILKAKFEDAIRLVSTPLRDEANSRSIANLFFGYLKNIKHYELPDEHPCSLYSLCREVVLLKQQGKTIIWQDLASALELQDKRSLCIFKKAALSFFESEPAISTTLAEIFAGNRRPRHESEEAPERLPERPEQIKTFLDSFPMPEPTDPESLLIRWLKERPREELVKFSRMFLEWRSPKGKEPPQPSTVEKANPDSLQAAPGKSRRRRVLMIPDDALKMIKTAADSDFGMSSDESTSRDSGLDSAGSPLTPMMATT